MIETEEGDILFPATEDYHILSMQCYCRIDENNKHIITTIVDYVRNQKHYKKVFENILEGEKENDKEIR